MAVDWYLFDGLRKLGPLTLNELKRLLEERHSSEVRLRLQGLDEPVAPADLPELSSGEPPRISAMSDVARRESTDALMATKPSRFNNFIAMNWRGEFPLGVTYWVFGVLGNIFAGLPVASIMLVFQPDGDYNPKAIFAAILAVWLGIGAIAVWQLVGVWRSANRHVNARVLLGKKSPWAAAAKVAVFLGVLQLAGAFLSSGWPQLLEAGRMSFLDDPDIPAYAIRVMRDGTEAEITGGFKYGLTDDFVRKLGAARQLKVIHLDSSGGRIGEATKLHKVIRSKGLDTYVSSNCMSACTVAFAAGTRRILRRGAVLGFHATSFPGMTNQELVGASHDQREIFSAAGFEIGFINKALSTPSTDLWEPTPIALLQARVITAISDGADFSMSGMGASPTKSDFAAMLSSAIPLMQPLRVRFPSEHDSIVQAYYDSFESGKTDAEAIAAGGEKLHGVLRRLRTFADDDVLSDIGAIYADQYNALGSKSPALCYRYASGVGPAVSPSEIPDALIAKEDAANRRVIETAAIRVVADATTSEGLWKKIGTVLTTKGIKTEQFDLLSAVDIPPDRHGDYCTVMTMLFREISKLPRREAGILMRDLLADK
jgi:hypothetical protein